MHDGFVHLAFLPAWSRDACGYLASALVLGTFSMQSMGRLRCLGIVSNLAFIAYALLAGMLPILILHGVLLPVNIWRLIQLKQHHLRAA